MLLSIVQRSMIYFSLYIKEILYSSRGFDKKSQIPKLGQVRGQKINGKY